MCVTALRVRVSPPPPVILVSISGSVTTKMLMRNDIGGVAELADAPDEDK